MMTRSFYRLIPTHLSLLRKAVVVSRQSSVRFCTLSLVFRSLNRIIAIEIAKILVLGILKTSFSLLSLNRIIEVGTSKILTLGILKTSFSLHSLIRIIDLMV